MALKNLLLKALLPLLLPALAAAAAAAQETDKVAEATKADGIYAVFETSMGTIVCKLHHDKAPITVANFIGLASGEKEFQDPKGGGRAKRPFYDGLKFHRVIKNFMIQGGCPLGNGSGGPGYRFIDEFDPSLRHDRPGVLSMANSGPGTNGSQFFITHVATPWLDDKHSIFGQCVLGQEVVNAMADVEMKGGGGGGPPSVPVTDIVLQKVTIVRTGTAAQAFDWAAEFAKQEEARARQAEAARKRTDEQLGKLARKLDFDPSKAETTGEGLRYVVTRPGTGAAPQKGQRIQAHYTGYLLDGTKFDSSVDRGQPFETAIGVGQVIKGWDIAFLGMKVGEKRILIIPSDLAYGPRGAGGVIPPNATLLFDVELLGIAE